MDKEDEKEVNLEKMDLEAQRTTYDGFMREYTKRLHHLRDGAIGELTNRKPGKKRNMTTRQWPQTAVGQKGAATLVPEGTSIWRVTQCSGWAIDCPPMRRYSCSALKAGSEYDAMVHVIRIAWETHLRLQGLSVDECLVERLWESEQSGAAVANAAASSSGGTAIAEAKPATRRRPVTECIECGSLACHSRSRTVFSKRVDDTGSPCIGRQFHCMLHPLLVACGG